MAIEKETGKKAAKKAPAKKAPAKKAPAKKAPKTTSALQAYEAAAAPWRRIVTMAWEDAGFLDQLKKNPKKILSAHGINISDEVTYVIHSDSDAVKNFVVPHRGKRAGGEGGDDQGEDHDHDPAF